MTAGRQDPDPPDLNRLYAAIDSARNFYIQQLHTLPDHGGPRGYLRDRCRDRQLLDAWQLGYAPPGWTRLIDHLRGRGHTDTDLIDAGLALRTRRGAVVDRFRDRLLAPYHDDRGRPVGFVGRAAPTVAPQVPRYLFHKHQHLLGLQTALPMLDKAAVPVLVEGLFDALAVTSASNGRWVGIAPSGTALTQDQVQALDTAVPMAARGIIVAYDNDPAGQTAAARTFPLLAATGAWPQHAIPDHGSDPAQMHPDALREALAEAHRRPLVTLTLGGTIAQHAGQLDHPGGRAACANALADALAPSPDRTRIARLLPAAAELIGCTPAQLSRVLDRRRTHQTASSGCPEQPPVTGTEIGQVKQDAGQPARLLDRPTARPTRPTRPTRQLTR